MMPRRVAAIPVLLVLWTLLSGADTHAVADLMRLDRFADAEAILNELWVDNADPFLSDDILLLRAECAFRQGYFLDAGVWFRQYLTLFPNHTGAQAANQFLGRIALLGGNRAAALEHFRKSGDSAGQAEASAPDRPDPKAASERNRAYDEARTALLLGDRIAALNGFRNAMELDTRPEARDYARLTAGRLLLELPPETTGYDLPGRCHEATAILSVPMETDACAVDALFWKGRALLAQRRLAEAAAAFSQLIERYSGDRHVIECRTLLGDIERQRGNPRVAMRNYQEALNLGADAGQVLPRMIRTQLDLGERAEARSLWHTLPDSARFEIALLDGLIEWGKPVCAEILARAASLAGPTLIPPDILHMQPVPVDVNALALGARAILESGASARSGLVAAINACASGDYDTIILLGGKLLQLTPETPPSAWSGDELAARIRLAETEMLCGRTDSGFYPELLSRRPGDAARIHESRDRIAGLQSPDPAPTADVRGLLTRAENGDSRLSETLDTLPPAHGRETEWRSLIRQVFLARTGAHPDPVVVTALTRASTLAVRQRAHRLLAGMASETGDWESAARELNLAALSGDWPGMSAEMKPVYTKLGRSLPVRDEDAWGQP